MTRPAAPATRRALAPAWARILLGGAACVLAERLAQATAKPPRGPAGGVVLLAAMGGGALLSIAADLDRARPRAGIAVATGILGGLAAAFVVDSTAESVAGVLAATLLIFACGALRSGPDTLDRFWCGAATMLAMLVTSGIAGGAAESVRALGADASVVDDVCALVVGAGACFALVAAQTRWADQAGGGA